MANILLTGGRAPATLELARAFHRVGHRVFMAESARGHLSEPSKALEANFLVPPPRQQTTAFIQSLKKIITQNKIDLLIPTCEEAFYVGIGRGQLPCNVFVEPIETLRMLHDKWAFALHAVDIGLGVPETFLVETKDELLLAFAQWKALVIKPAYSRFATRTLVRPTIKQAVSALEADPAGTWIAQQYVNGPQICSYSIAHSGHITAHTAYRSDFTAGKGATIAFKHIDHPVVFDWVQKFVSASRFTGQIAFDFIETPDGQILGLECNPRATSGIHLLASSPKFTEAFFNPTMDCLIPSGKDSFMLSTGMLVYGLPASIFNGNLGKWFSTFFSSNDVIFNASDPMPFLLQFRGILNYFMLGLRHHMTSLEASTYDIEWNG